MSGFYFFIYLLIMYYLRLAKKALLLLHLSPKFSFTVSKLWFWSLRKPKNSSFYSTLSDTRVSHLLLGHSHFFLLRCICFYVRFVLCVSLPLFVFLSVLFVGCGVSLLCFISFREVSFFFFCEGVLWTAFCQVVRLYGCLWVFSLVCKCILPRRLSVLQLMSRKILK